MNKHQTLNRSSWSLSIEVEKEILNATWKFKGPRSVKTT